MLTDFNSDQRLTRLLLQPLKILTKKGEMSERGDGYYAFMLVCALQNSNNNNHFVSWNVF